MRIGVMLRNVGEKGGVGLYTRNIVKNLLEIDKDNQYVLFYQGKRRKTSFSGYSNVEEQWINVPYKMLWDQIFIPFSALKSRIDLLFSPKWTVPLVLPCKTVIVVPDVGYYLYPEFYGLKDILYLKFIIPLYLRKTTRIIAVSHTSKKDIIKFTGVDKSKIVAIHVATDIFTGPLNSSFIEKVKTKYALPSRFILHVGIIYPEKNVERLIQAFAKVAEKFPHKLVLVGGFRWKYSRVFGLIEEFNLKDKVIITNWIPRSELPAFYKLADLFAFPSLYEGFGVPVLEAMACGCPVVTSSTGATPEIVGDAALIVNPKSVDEIYKATVRVLEDEKLKKELVSKGYARAKKFSWEKSARETLSVFKELEG
ncbi:unnamed protein product [marine sediment metagenome]|uniref:Glycosyl transferase family 1 domain-containing protein n=1 Tax=marine sediment metagenome TaxID=412755 RepID=X1FFG1_9ZZZZ